MLSGITKWGIFSDKSGYFYYAIHMNRLLDAPAAPGMQAYVAKNPGPPGFRIS